MARLVEETLGVPAATWQVSLTGLLQVRPPPQERISAPTLLLTGSGDDLVREDQQVLLARIPDVELNAYDDVGHGPHLARPASVAADVTAFLHGDRLRAAARPDDPSATS